MPKFVVKLSHRSDGKVLATFPDVPMAIAYGRNAAEAYENAAKALARALRRYVEEGFDLPRARARGGLSVHVEAPQQLAPA
jgi:predicted RNase H-like HicB family nuclease